MNRAIAFVRDAQAPSTEPSDELRASDLDVLRESLVEIVREPGDVLDRWQVNGLLSVVEQLRERRFLGAQIGLKLAELRPYGLRGRPRARQTRRRPTRRRALRSRSLGEGGLYFLTPTARGRTAKVEALGDFLVAALSNPTWRTDDADDPSTKRATRRAPRSRRNKPRR